MAEDRSYDTSGKLRSYSNDETPLRSTGETVEATTDISSHSNTLLFCLLPEWQKTGATTLVAS